MSTVAAALQIPTSTPAPQAAPSLVAPGAATQLAGEEFVLALTQALRSAAPPTAVAQVASLVVSDTPLTEAPMTQEPSTEELAAAFAGMLALPLLTPSSTAAPRTSADPLELLSASSAAARPGGTALPTLPTLQALQTTLSGALAAAASGAPAGEAALAEATPEVASSQPESTLLFAASVERQPQPAPAADAPPSSRPLQHSVGTQAWNEELGTRVTVMAERGQQSASLRLSPEHLGPLEIRIAIRDDQASVWFGAAHADTRAAIEHALPRLREMFAAQGMSLTDAGVSREPPREQLPTPSRQGSGVAEPASETLVTSLQVSRAGLIDAYA